LLKDKKTGSAGLAVVRWSALGDIAAAIPVFRAFEVPICIVTSPLGYELLKDEFDEFTILKKKTFTSMTSALTKLKKKKIDQIIDLQSNDRSRLLSMFFRSVYNSKGVDTKQPVTRVFYDIARKTGQLSPLDMEFTKKERSFIVINAGSSPKWLSKRLPFNVWKEMSEKLYEKFALPFFIIGEEREKIYLDQLSRSLTVPVVNLAGKTSIQELKALLKDAFLTISTDSAAMHISAACKTPTIGIFGATNWIRSAPYGPWSTVLYDRTLYTEGIPPMKNLTEPGSYYDHLDLDRALEEIKDYL
jgi:ADP-heptose:LPS heptosyltransferase